MLLQLETSYRPATDLGYLLHKNPDRLHSKKLAFGSAHVFYPVAEPDLCRAAVLLEVDPIGLVRGKRPFQSGTLGQYVNDRPYVASSFMSVALAQLFSSAMAGRSRERPELVNQALPLKASLPAISFRGGQELLQRLFAPLGYQVEAERLVLDPKFPAWGEGRCWSLQLAHTLPVAKLLQHLYILLPVLDNEKHYWVGPAETEKLLAKASAWLPDHPEKDLIVRRYLKYQGGLTRIALARLAPEENPDPDGNERQKDAEEAEVERPLSMNQHRHAEVLSALKACGAQSVLDLGCGEGRLLRELLREKQFQRIVGLDVSLQALERAANRLHLERMGERQRQRIELWHGSLTYRDKRLKGFDAAAMVDVIEHLDPPRLAAFQRVLFECAQPKTVVITTPNREYNVRWKSLPAGHVRHRDHRFEWTRSEFEAWAAPVAEEFGYQVRFGPVGPLDEEVGAPTQMAVFDRN
ncbi:MAG: 3' terminal RNA ribose 2'-O-methyltransferase Hen1 [Planctomycetota bacterium]|nr:MAG: 3' terminal RNA ribose 2'-O-methyltransferase Hen1 [Planctomycetota bacterium]